MREQRRMVTRGALLAAAFSPLRVDTFDRDLGLLSFHGAEPRPHEPEGQLAAEPSARRPLVHVAVVLRVDLPGAQHRALELHEDLWNSPLTLLRNAHVELAAGACRVGPRDGRAFAVEEA